MLLQTFIVTMATVNGFHLCKVLWYYIFPLICEVKNETIEIPICISILYNSLALDVVGDGQNGL